MSTARWVLPLECCISLGSWRIAWKRWWRAALGSRFQVLSSKFYVWTPLVAVVLQTWNLELKTYNLELFSRLPALSPVTAGGSPLRWAAFSRKELSKPNE